MIILLLVAGEATESNSNPTPNYYNSNDYSVK